jgi:hypothetical protein
MSNAKSRIEANTGYISFSEGDRFSKFKQITPQIASIIIHI